jgi:hypothetical protein
MLDEASFVAALDGESLDHVLVTAADIAPPGLCSTRRTSTWRAQSPAG